ncbi:MAG TPA: twin-arginine translocation signal domain-containing protein, partial [Kiritimatiellia bacterium]|nr:twin-arginine translocation signal domain-containing protein [Kiritimatiellia bacterium]
MERRDFIKKTGLGLVAVAGTAAVPAMAQTTDLPVIKWRMASSFPKSLDTIYGAGEVLARRLSEITEGKFEIRVFAGGE